MVEAGILLALIAIVFALSWLTYRYIETPIRHGGHGRSKATALLAAMTLVGVMGYFSIPRQALRGDSENERDFSRQIGWTIPVASKKQIDLCNTRFPEWQRIPADPESNNFCILQRDATPDVLMVGDSMNLSFFPGLARFDDYNLLLLAASYAAPLYNVSTLASSEDSLRVANYKLTNQALDYALNNDNIKVVVMSFLHGPRIFSRYQPIELIRIDKKSEQPLPRIFAESLASTLNLLLSKGKQVIYILPNPALNFEPTRCLGSFRPFTVGNVAKHLCAQPRNEHLSAGGQRYRDLSARRTRPISRRPGFRRSQPFLRRAILLGHEKRPIALPGPGSLIGGWLRPGCPGTTQSHPGCPWQEITINPTPEFTARINMTTTASTYGYRPSGDTLIDSITNGFYWELDSSKTINWSISNGFNGEYWNNISNTTYEIGTALKILSYYIDVNFNYAGALATLPLQKTHQI